VNTGIEQRSDQAAADFYDLAAAPLPGELESLELER